MKLTVTEIAVHKESESPIFGEIKIGGLHLIRKSLY